MITGTWRQVIEIPSIPFTIELFELSDRLQVIAAGRLSPSIPIAQASVGMIGEWMSGLWPVAPEVDHAA